jgi:hypothetical protein
MRRRAALSVIATLAAAGALAAAPTGGAQPPPSQGCDIVFVSNGATEVSLLGTVNVNTPGTSLTVNLGCLAGPIVCPLLGGGGVTPPALP